MTTPPKYEDLVLKVAEMERREAALLEEASCLKAVLNGMEFKQVDDMVSAGVDACLFLGQESARIIKGIQAERAALREELEVANNACSILNDLTKTISTEKHALQQRLTVAEHRVGELESAAREMLRIAGIANQGSNAYNRAIINLNDALKPAAGSRCY